MSSSSLLVIMGFLRSVLFLSMFGFEPYTISSNGSRYCGVTAGESEQMGFAKLCTAALIPNSTVTAGNSVSSFIFFKTLYRLGFSVG